MNLNVPFIAQEQGSHDCALAGISMILKYYNVEKTVDDIKRDLHDDGSFYYMPQIGTYLLSLGFDVKIITQHPGLFILKDAGMNSESLKLRFQKLKEYSKNAQNNKVLDYFIEFVESGGRIIIKVPDEKDVEEEILAGRPLGAALTTNFMYQATQKVNFNSHFQVITGFDEKHIFVNDPLPDDMGGKQKFLIKDFFYGMYSSAYMDLDNASLLLINPKDL